MNCKNIILKKTPPSFQTTPNMTEKSFTGKKKIVYATTHIRCQPHFHQHHFPKMKLLYFIFTPH